MIVAVVCLYRRYTDRDTEYDIIRRDNSDMDYANDRVETLRLEQDTKTRLLYGLDKTEDLIVSPYVIRIRRMIEELVLMLNGEDPSLIGKEHLSRRVSTASRNKLGSDLEMGVLDDEKE